MQDDARINAHLHRRPRRHIGFDGAGKQGRDLLHPRDLAALRRDFGWSPELREAILEAIARHAEGHPDWLERSAL